MLDSAYQRRAFLFRDLFWMRHAAWVQHEGPEPPPIEPEHLSQAPQWFVREWKGPLPYGAQPGSRLSLDEARAKLDAELAAYLTGPVPDYGLLIKAIPGLGKTTAAVKAIENVWDYSQGRVAYCGPRHDFYEDLMNVQTMSKPDWWLHWWARQVGDEDAGRPQTCRYADHMTQWLQRGYRAYKFCLGVCGGPYLKNDCIYNAQAQSQCPVVYCQHQHVTMGHPMSSEFGLVIGDEWPLAAFLDVWAIPEKWIVPSSMSDAEDMKGLLAEMRALTEAGESLYGEKLMEALGGPSRVLSTTERMAGMDIPLEHIFTPRLGYNRPEDVSNVDYCHAVPLAKLLQREATRASQGLPWVWRVWLGGHMLHLYQRRHYSPKLPTRLVWLDATAKPELYERLFGRKFKVVDLAPEMQGRIYQVADRAYGKSTMVKGDGDNLELTENVRAVERVTTKIMEDRSYTRPGVVGPKDVVDRSPYFSAMIHTNYYGARGTNELELCDALFVIGTPQPSGPALLDIARSLWFDQDEPFDLRRYAEPCPYNYVDDDGKAWAYPLNSYWGDEALFQLLEATREDEIVQAVHRARPLHHDVDIWLLTTTPTSLPLTKLTSSRELFDVPDGTNDTKWLAFYELASRCQAEGRDLSASDALRALNLDRRTIYAYIAKLVEEFGWEMVGRPPARGGRAPKVARPPR